MLVRDIAKKKAKDGSQCCPHLCCCCMSICQGPINESNYSIMVQACSCQINCRVAHRWRLWKISTPALDTANNIFISNVIGKHQNDLFALQIADVANLWSYTPLMKDDKQHMRLILTWWAKHLLLDREESSYKGLAVSLNNAWTRLQDGQIVECVWSVWKDFVTCVLEFERRYIWTCSRACCT